MKNALLCSLFAMCFLHLEAARLTDMLPQLKGARKMKGIHETVKEVMRPFGCLEIVPGPEMTKPCLECLQKVVGDIKADNSKNKRIRLPSFKKTLEKFTQCKLEKYNIIVDGKFSLDRHNAFRESITYIKSNPEDLAMMNDAIDVCQTRIDFNNLSAVRAALALEKCIAGEAINRCTESKGVESVGAVLPTIYALHSLFEDNDKCDSVKADEEELEEYFECVEEEEDSSEEKRVPFSSSNPMETAFQILKDFKELPEIDCLIELSDEYGLRKDGQSYFPGLSKYVSEMEGWSDEAVKQEVIGKIDECANVEVEIAWKKDINFQACFLPAFADICGLDNELSREVLFPMLNEEFMSDILNRINDRYDLDDLMKMIHF